MSKVIFLNSSGQHLLTLTTSDATIDDLHQAYYDYTGIMILSSDYTFDGDNHVVRILESDVSDKYTLATGNIDYLDYLLGYR